VSQTRRKEVLVRRIKGGYAATARSSGRGLRRMGLLPELPPARDQRLRHWAFSLTCAHDTLALADLDVPWWTYRAIDAVETWLAGRPRPIRVFEYGSGASTLWLAHRAQEVWTVEHDVGFAALLNDRFAAAGNVTVQVIPPVAARQPVVPSAKEGYAGLDFATYVAAIDELGSFDLVVVDGRARQACLTHALPRLRGDGLVVFDNSARRRYRPAIAAAKVVETRLRGLTPTLPYPEQTSLLRPRQKH
jgi:predicted O-methyltransferase YrrM